MATDAKVDQALAKLDTLLNQTSSLVTLAQLEVVKSDLKAILDDEIEKVHLEYAPLKKNITWFIRALILEGIAIIGQAIIIYLIARS